MLKDNKTKADFEQLSEDEWAGTVNRHIRELDRVVTDAIRKSIRDYVLIVFAGAYGEDLKMIGDLLDGFRDYFIQKDISKDLDRRTLFDKRQDSL